MIRNAVIHLSGEQPLLADLYDLPKADDVGLVCTNLRGLDGKRPVFVDRIDSQFFFPYLHIRFLEIPPGAAAQVPELTAPEEPAEPAIDLEPEPDLEIDEDFLRRIREA